MFFCLFKIKADNDNKKRKNINIIYDGRKRNAED